LISVLRRTGLWTVVFLRLGRFWAAIFLRLAAFCAAFFLLAGFFAAFFLATFFLAAFFLVAGFFFATFFLLAAFFFDGFLAARFLLARRFAADFFATAFLLATFLLLAAFFAAGFFRATDFFLDDFFAATFLFATLRFVPDDFLRVDGLLLAAFFREDLAGLRFLLAVFFAGILISYRTEKNAQLYIAALHMEAQNSRFFCSQFLSPDRRLSGVNIQLPDGPRSGIFSGSQRHLPLARNNRFMPRITLHYPEFTGMGVTPADAT
jgi:hypothetical protein